MTSRRRLVSPGVRRRGRVTNTAEQGREFEPLRENSMNILKATFLSGKFAFWSDRYLSLVHS